MSAKWTFWAWEQQIKTAPKKLALLQLANNANDDGKSWYSITKMADACGVSERTFQRQVQSLEQDGLLHVERRNNRPSIYTLTDEVEIVLHDEGCQSVTSGCQSDGAGCQSVTLGGVTESHDPNSNPNNDPNIDINSAFEVFWSAGMRKVNKSGALKSFKKAFKDSKEESVIRFGYELAEDVALRIKSRQFGFDKMHPTTYLNQQRWNDEYETTNSTNAPAGRKLTAEEERNQELLRKYGNPASQRGWAESQFANSGVDQYEVQRGFSEQMGEEGVTIDMDSGDWSFNG